MEETVKQLQAELAALKQSLEDKTKGFDEAKTKLTESSQFIEDASILVSAIVKDPDLASRVQASIAGKTAPVTPPTPPTNNNKDWKFDPTTGKPIGEVTPPTAPVDKRVDSLDGEKRLEIIDAVESRFKYSNLKAEEKSAIRKNVGAWLSSYGMKVAEIPVDQLKEKLTDAYLHVGLETASKDAKTEVVDSYFNDPGKLPSMGSNGQDNSEAQLSQTQKKWAGKLQIPEDKVAAGLKELTETGVITYKPKEVNSVSKVVPPSGQPIPPIASN